MNYTPLMKSIRNNLLLFTSSVVTFGLVLVHTASALTISPPRIEIAGDPGTVITGEIDLFNEENEAKVFYSSTANFEARGEGGVPHFLPEREGLATWISVESRVPLEPQERRTVPFSINIPTGANPGGHFAAIFWSTAPPEVEGGGQIAVGAKLGVLVLLRVTGDIEEAGGIVEFGTKPGQFFTALPVVFEYRFSNDGDDRLKPEGEIRVRNILGMTSAVIDANKGEGNVLPRSSRTIEAVWHSRGQNVDDLTKQEELAIFDRGNEERGFFETAQAQWNNFAFGMYSAELSLTYGQEGKTSEATHRFFVLPWQLLSIIIIILALVGIIGRTGIRRYNRWIIKNARSEGA
jgi:hypothetical protein